MAPNTVGREERNVRKVAHAIVRVAKHGLPGGLCPSLAASADNAIYGRQAGRAAAGSSTGGYRGLKILLSRWTVAKAAAAVGRGVPFKLCNQRTRAGIIPRNLGNVRTRRCKCGRIRGIPVSAVCPCESIAKIGSSHGHVIGTGGQRIDAYAVGCARDVVVARGGSAVTCRNEDGDALAGGLLIRRIERRVGRRAIRRFACAVADAHDGRRLVA